MKGLIALVAVLVLALGLGTANAQYSEETNRLIHLWVYGTDSTYISGVPSGLALGVSAPVLYSAHVFPGEIRDGVTYSEETIALDSGFVLEKMVADSLGVSVSDLPKRAPAEGGITNIYREMGLMMYPDSVVLAGD